MRPKRRISLVGSLLSGIIAVSNFGCGGGSASVPPPPPPPAINVSLSEATATVQAGATAQFTATVINDSAGKGVTWSVSCSASACGSIFPTATPSGTPTIYTAPSTGASLTVTLTAISAADGTKSASATITVAGSVPAMVIGTVAVGTAPSAIAVDSSSNKVYVADFGTQPGFGPQACSPTGADVTVIDGATESTTAVPVSSPFKQLNPVGIALNLASHTVYVVVRENTPNVTVQSCTHVIDGIELVGISTPINNRFIYQTITELSGMDINQVTGDIYVGHTFASVSSIVVIGGNGVVATISVGSNFSGCTGDNLCFPISVAVNANMNKIYVAKRGSNSITVIDGATNSVTATITDPSAVAPVAIAVNSRTNTIYVANAGSDNLTVIDGATGSVTATVPVGISPSGVAVDEQTNFIYIANAGNSQTGDPGNVTVINGATNTTTTVSDPKAINPVAVAANPATNKIYVANRGSNNVTVINGAH